MKERLFLVSFLLVLVSYGQSSKKAEAPFQILFAENVDNGKGEKIKSLDVLSAGEKLIVNKGGFISMVHRSGHSFEISEDTIIYIDDLQSNFIKLPRQLGLVKLAKKKDGEYYLLRPNIEHLFIKEGRLARKSKLSLNGVCFDCNVEMEIVYPPNSRNTGILFDHDLCLSWRSAGSSNYELEFTNIFDEKLLTLTSSTNEIKIANEILKSFFDREDILMLRIKELTTKKASDLFIVRRFKSTDLEFPFSCSPSKATYALMAGLYLELSPYSNEAEEYFILATTLSSRQFFKDMLHNFQKRQEK